MSVKSVVLLILGTISIVMAEWPEFKVSVIDTFGNRMGQTALVDLDHDGDMDWVFGERGKMYWYEYRNADEWILHDLGQGARTDVGGTVHDVDRDGWLDIIAGTGWYRNPGNPADKTFEFFSSQAIGCHDNVVADLDQDGLMDVIACSNDTSHPFLNWYRIPQDPTQPWIETRMGTGIHGGVSPAGVGDLDFDGDIDVVRGDSWFQNHDRGKKWVEHADLIPPGGSRVGRYGLAIKSWVTDLDKDGDPDIVQAEADYPSCRVFWWENVNQAQRWIFHAISQLDTDQDFHSLAVADFDLDGDLDVFSGGGPLSKATHKMYIWENLDKTGNSWKEHLLLSGKRCHEAVAADVDHDGDIDICTKPWHGNTHLFLRNMLNETRKGIKE
ncbi:hypothetical protein GF406_02210 [candidate division KSB1 bacterium]|nr:hypothetical protein [candidate division KSB1 bacterium]